MTGCPSVGGMGVEAGILSTWCLRHDTSGEPLCGGMDSACHKETYFMVFGASDVKIYLTMKKEKV